MRIAVTYDNGEIFQHFGHSEEFKIYEVEDGQVVDSQVISSNGQGHGALAQVLSEHNIDALICGGIGGGAMNALSDAGIEVCAGVSGDADEAVEYFLQGELESTGVNCDHHGEGHSCGNHEEGHSCHCGGGCGHHAPAFDGPNVGKTVSVHYCGTLDDGSQFDSSYDRGEPLEFVCGAGMMIEGFDRAVASMEVGQIVNVHLLPEEAYGQSDPEAIFTLQIEQLPGAEDLSAGMQVYLSDQLGRPFPVQVLEVTEETITFDANHELAGKALNFKIELLSVED